jgi:hypothetical protein
MSVTEQQHEAEKQREAIEEIAANNPAVDVEQVVEASRLVDELRKEGLGRPEYNIEPPYRSFPRRT